MIKIKKAIREFRENIHLPFKENSSKNITSHYV